MLECSPGPCNRIQKEGDGKGKERVKGGEEKGWTEEETKMDREVQEICLCQIRGIDAPASYTRLSTWR